MFNVWSIFGSIGLDPSEAKRGLKESEDAARKAAGTMEREVKRATTSIERRLANVGTAMTRLGSQLSLRVTAPIVALGVATLKTAGDFEASMNSVGAITQATGDEIASLEALAKDLGATTQYSATQAADAMSFLAMAGFKTNEILGALPGTLQLAAAGKMDLARAADIASNVLTGFGLNANEINRVNDVMAATAMNANTNIEQLGEGMKYVAPVAAGLGVSVEETSAAIGLLSNAGLQASSAGTGLRQILSTLVLKTDEVGVSVRDAAGNMRPLADILEDLERKSFSADQALELFGMRGGPSLTALLSQGSDALREMTDELQNAGGTAERIATAQMQGLSGALKNLRSAAEAVTLAIADSGILEFATNLTERVTGLLRKLAEVNPVALRTGVVIAGIAAAIGPLLIVLGGFTKLLGLAIIGAKGLGLALGVLSGPVGIIAGVVTGVILLGGWLKGRRDSLDAKMQEGITRTREFSDALASANDKASLRSAVRTMSQEIEGPGRAAFVNYAEEAIRTGDTLAEVSRNIGREWAQIVNAAEISRLKARRSGLQAQVDAFEARLAVRRTHRDAAMEEVRALQAELDAAIATGTTELVTMLESRIALAMSGISMHVSDATLAYESGAARIIADIERIDAEIADWSGEHPIDVGVNVTVTHTPHDGGPAEDGLPDLVGDLAGPDGVVDVPVEVHFLEGSLGRLNEELQAAQQQLMSATTEAAQAIALATVHGLEATIIALEERIALLAMGPARNIPQPGVSVSIGTAPYDLAGGTERATQTAAFNAARLRRQQQTAWAEAQAEEVAARERYDQLQANLAAQLTRQQQTAWAEAEAQAVAARERYDQLQANLAAQLTRQQREAWTEAEARDDAMTAWNASQLTAARDLQAQVDEAYSEHLAAEADAAMARWTASQAFAAARLTAQHRAGQQQLEDDEAYYADARERYAEMELARARGHQKAIDDAMKASLRTIPRPEITVGGGAADYVAEQERLALLREEIDRRAELIASLTTMSADKGPLANFGASLLNLAIERIPLLGSAIEGFVQAGPIGALASVFTELLGRSEAFGRIMAKLNNILEPIVSVFDTLLTAVEPIIDVAIALVEVALSPLVWIVENVVAPVLTWFADMIKSIYNALFGWLTGRIGEGKSEWDDEGSAADHRTPEQAAYDKNTERERAARAAARERPEQYGSFQEWVNAGWHERMQVRLSPMDLLQMEMAYWQAHWQDARTEAEFAEANLELERVREEVRRLQELGLDDFGPDDMPTREPRELEPVSFGGTPHATQLAVATPLLEASNIMLDAAQLMRDAFAGFMPSGPSLGLAALPPFTSAIERMTPVLERLLGEGVSINVAAAAGGTLVSPTAHLRGL